MELQKPENPQQTDQLDTNSILNPFLQNFALNDKQNQSQQFQVQYYQQLLQLQQMQQMQQMQMQLQNQLVPFQIMVPMQQLSQMGQFLAYSPENINQLQQQYQQLNNQLLFQQQIQKQNNNNNVIQNTNGTNLNIKSPENTNLQQDSLNNIPDLSFNNQTNTNTASTINVINPKTPLEIKQNSKQNCTENKLKKKKQKDNKSNNEAQQIIQTDIWKKDNIRPHTGHVPTNFMNILIPYLLKIWRDKIPCKKGLLKKEVDVCECDVCKEFSILRKMKANRKNVSLNSFCVLWKNEKIRAVSEDFILNNSFNSIMNHQGYRNSVTRTSLLLCLKYFQKNVKNPQQFYKLSD